MGFYFGHFLEQFHHHGEQRIVHDTPIGNSANTPPQRLGTDLFDDAPPKCRCPVHSHRRPNLQSLTEFWGYHARQTDFRSCETCGGFGGGHTREKTEHPGKRGVVHDPVVQRLCVSDFRTTNTVSRTKASFRHEPKRITEPGANRFIRPRVHRFLHRFGAVLPLHKPELRQTAEQRGSTPVTSVGAVRCPWRCVAPVAGTSSSPSRTNRAGWSRGCIVGPIAGPSSCYRPATTARTRATAAHGPTATRRSIRCSTGARPITYLRALTGEAVVEEGPIKPAAPAAPPASGEGVAGLISQRLYRCRKLARPNHDSLRAPAALSNPATLNPPPRAPDWTERQGILVEAEAVRRAEAESAADAEKRAQQQKKAAKWREKEDQAYIATFAKAIAQQFPGCPKGDAQEIAFHACQKYSGRVGPVCRRQAVRSDGHPSGRHCPHPPQVHEVRQAAGAAR